MFPLLSFFKHSAKHSLSQEKPVVDFSHTPLSKNSLKNFSREPVYIHDQSSSQSTLIRHSFLHT